MKKRRTADLPEPALLAAKVLEVFGGKDQLLAAARKNLKESAERWQQDTEAIGRILRAHLFVEHFLTEFVRWRSPGLTALTEARLTFYQKLTLAGGAHV